MKLRYAALVAGLVIAAAIGVAVAVLGLIDDLETVL
jgi:hypothetical protein